MEIENLSLESDNAHYNVYVIELSNDVLKDKKFRDRNPNALPNCMCVYVGMTGLDPSERYRKHKLGIKSNKYAEKYGVRLLPNLTRNYNNMTYYDALAKEKELAEELRLKNYAVWQA
jgi:hypothetical protein